MALRDTVRAILPTNVLSLMDSIESSTGREIEIAENPCPVSPTDPNPNAPAAMVRKTHASIYLRDTSYINPQGILHELLHIERYCVQQVPQVLPSPMDVERLKVTSAIENTLEHLVIVPREQDFGFEPHSYWNSTTQRLWKHYPWPEMTDPWVRRKNCLLGSLSLANVNDKQVHQLVRNCLAKEGLLGEAEKFRDRVHSLIELKPRLVSCVLRFLKISRDEARLVTYDIRNQAEVHFEIPHH